MPIIDKGRYYSLQFIDMYTFDFAYVGSRTTGNEAGQFLLAGPSWKGGTPPAVKAVIRSETDFAFVLYRTQLFSEDDIDNVKRIQSGYKVEALSQFLGEPAPPAPPAIDFIKPLSAESEKTSLDFFNILDFVLQFAPTDPSETEIMARFARLGLGARGAFDAKTLSPEIREAVAAGMADAWATFEDYKRTELDTGKRTSADAFGTRAFLNGDYMPACPRPCSASTAIPRTRRSTRFISPITTISRSAALTATTFASPLATCRPVNAFWSVTLYQLPASLLSANPLNRYLINSSMLPNLEPDPDGSLTIDVQHESPGAQREANWLPAPTGPFMLVMRLYWPKPEALNEQWKAPPLVVASAAHEAASGSTVPVTPDNFVRAESDLYFGNIVKDGGFGKFLHRREPAAIDNQTVIRLNRDTLYSAAVFDLDAGPVTITLPDAAKRFMSMQVIDEDQYTPQVLYGAGSYTLTKEKIGTRYIVLVVRTLVDPNDPEDAGAVRILQDAIKVDQPGGPGTFEVPHWDQASQAVVREHLLALAATLPDTKRMFGPKEEVDPVRRLIGSASAWGGNPERDALYLNVTPAKNDGQTIYRLDVKDVPVDGFWSVSVYNAKGYFEPNALNAYTLNNITAKAGPDGAIAIQFGGCDGKISNCLPITSGWNYLVRLYRPRPEILDGSWKFPEARPTD